MDVGSILSQLMWILVACLALAIGASVIVAYLDWRGRRELADELREIELVVRNKALSDLEKFQELAEEIQGLKKSLDRLEKICKAKGLDELDYALLKAKVEYLKSEVAKLKQAVETLGQYIDELHEEIRTLRSRLEARG